MVAPRRCDRESRRRYPRKRSRSRTGAASPRSCTPRARSMTSRRRSLLPERKVLYQFSARGHDLAQILLGLQLTDPHDGVARLLPLAPADAGARASASRTRPPVRWRARGSFSGGRDIGVVFNLPGRGGADGAAGLRRRRRAVHAGRRLGAGDPLPARGPRRRRLCAQHRRGARRRCLDRDQRLLVGAQHRDHAAAADAVLHRGQRLRHLGALDLQTPGGNIAANLRRLRAASRSSRATAPIRARPRADPQGGRARARRARARAAAAHRAAPVRTLGPGHAGLQVGRAARARSARAIRCARLQRFLVPQVLARGRVARSSRARRAREVEEAVERALARPQPDPRELDALRVQRTIAGGTRELQQQGGLLPGRLSCHAPASERARAGGDAHQHADRDPPHARCASSP